jgi:glutathione synthase
MSDELKKLGISDEFIREASILSATQLVSFLPEPNKPVNLAPLRHALFPRKFPKHLFDEINVLSPIFHKLVQKIVSEKTWILNILSPLGEYDDFLKNFLEIARKSTRTPGKELYIFRSDYMENGKNDGILQIELNTISAGFACMSEQLSKVQKANLMKFHGNLKNHYFPADNRSGTKIAEIMSSIVKSENPYSRVLFVVSSSEKNEVDQRLLEWKLLELDVYVDRMTLKQISEKLMIDSITKKLVSKENHDIIYSLVYFREGYSPEAYPTEVEWNTRLMIENADCFVSPSTMTQLAGTKKIQQMWCEPTDLTKFLSPSEIAQLRRVFAVQLDPSVDQSDALENIDDWILKPQREGGGWNFYGQDMKKKLLESDHDELRQYILMKKIRPPSSQAIVASHNQITGNLKIDVIKEAVGEIGIFSIYCPAILKEGISIGHMIRTKNINTNEGGVNSGYGYLDTADLYTSETL